VSETEADRELDAKQPQIEDFFAKACVMPSDINEHLPLLQALTQECVKHGRTSTNAPSGGHVTEFGLRWATGSTVAFLAGKPKQLVSWDLEPLHVVHQNVLDLLRAVALDERGQAKPPGQTRWQPRTGDTLEITIEETDLIFFDTLHTAKQLLAELFRHGPKARKYIVCHDTQTFGDVGEDGSTPGLLAAINRFQKEWFPLWRVIEKRTNNNGLVVLQRETDFQKHPWRSWITTGEGDPNAVGAPGPV